MALPPQFQRGGRATASYDWLDLTSGCGYRRYYACCSQNSTTTLYLLTTKELDSTPGYIYGATTGGIGVQETVADVDFDITIKVPCYIVGDAYINLTMGILNNFDGAVNVALTVYHVTAAAAETSLGTITTTTRLNGADLAKYWRECIKIALTGKKFAIGEKLRLNCILGGYRTGGDSCSPGLYCDPSSRLTITDTNTGTTSGTDLTFDAPFKIDIT